MINDRIDSLFRFRFITEKNVKFYGKSISDFALFTFQKSHLTLLKFPVRACVFRFSLVNVVVVAPSIGDLIDRDSL